MVTTQTLQIRIDPELDKMLDELTAFYAERNVELLGEPLTRSACVRVILRAAHRDMAAHRDVVAELERRS